MNDVAFSGAAILVVTGLLGALSGAVVSLFKLYVASRDREVEALRQERDSYRTISERAVLGLEALANDARRGAGQPPLPGVLAAIPTHSSPVTQSEQDSADVATLAARMAVVAADLDLAHVAAEPLEYAAGVKPREVRAVPPPGTPGHVDVIETVETVVVTLEEARQTVQAAADTLHTLAQPPAEPPTEAKHE